MDIITDDEVYEYACCPSKYYLNKYAKGKIKDGESLYLSHLSELIEKNRRKICKSLRSLNTIEESDDIYSKSYKLMKKGEENIHGAVLCANGFISRPFLLEKTEKSSNLGKHSYQILDFIPSIQFSEEYKIKLAFQSYLLYFSLGFMPSNCKMINIKREVLEFNPVTLFEDVKVITDNIRKIEYKKEYPVCCINLHCKICRWRDKCMKECIGRKDLSVLFGVTRNRRQILLNNNINSFEDLTKANDKLLSHLKEEGIKNIKFLVKQSFSFIKNKPLILLVPKIPKRSPFLYFDIEGQIDLNFQYLFGIYNEDSSRYISFWADEIENEKEAFVKLINYLKKTKKYTLVHYGNYEKTVIRELCFKYNIPKKTEEKIIKSMIDLYSIVKKSTALPLLSYSLKDVAKFIGFKWKDKDALGVNSIIWHNDWLNTKDTKCKNRILQYNEDDCKATMFLMKWLLKLREDNNEPKRRFV